jgi:hypothetical protein
MSLSPSQLRWREPSTYTRYSIFVIPAKAGTQANIGVHTNLAWVPACAGMTAEGVIEDRA